MYNLIVLLVEFLKAKQNVFRYQFRKMLIQDTRVGSPLIELFNMRQSSIDPHFNCRNYLPYWGCNPLRRKRSQTEPHKRILPYSFGDLSKWFLVDYIQRIIIRACIHYLLYIYFYCYLLLGDLSAYAYTTTTTTTSIPNLSFHMHQTVVVVNPAKNKDKPHGIRNWSGSYTLNHRYLDFLEVLSNTSSVTCWFRAHPHYATGQKEAFSPSEEERDEEQNTTAWARLKKNGNCETKCKENN